MPKKRVHFQSLWPALLAILVVGGLYFSVQPTLTLGPTWLPFALVASLAVLTAGFHKTGISRPARYLDYLSSGVLTLFLVASVCLLVAKLPSHQEKAADLLRSSVVLWITNIIVFATWYWRLDGGGPYERTPENYSVRASFLFPQLTLKPELKVTQKCQQWSPEFMDYLFIAFTTNTAFSPTDTGALSSWAKIVMMMQSMIALVIIVVLAGKVVNAF